MKYRSSANIISNILTVANGGSSRVGILYKCYLSHEQFKKFMSKLIKDELITIEGKSRIYRTTPKGLKLLQAIRQLEDMLHIDADSIAQ